MDPFSLAVGIAGLAGLAASTIRVIKSYISNVKNAESSITALITELEALHSNLSSLDGFLHSLPNTGLTFQHTSALRSCASSCEIKLNALSKKLGQVGNTKASRFKWPLSEKEHMKTVHELRAFTQWIQFSLSIDGCSLLSQTSSDVLQVLERQVESFRVLKSIGEETSQLENAVRDQTRILQDDHKAKKRNQILDWISVLDHDQKHYTVRSPRVGGTGIWLLHEPQYIQWRDDSTPANVLWCCGGPGTGKSVLTSMVIDELKNSSCSQFPVAFFYFDYRDQDSQTPVNMLSNILRQIIAAMPDIPRCVINAYERSSGSEAVLSMQELEDLLHSVTELAPVVYIAIDALDECDEPKHRKPFLQFFSRLREKKKVRLFFTSRPHLHDINTAFHGCPKVQVQAHDVDLISYMQQEFSSNDVFDIVDDDFVAKIVQKILHNAHGMFLLPILQLRTILKEPTIGEMEDALASFSSSLPEAFERTITRIQRLPESRRRLGINSLMWICNSRRPMTVLELSDALSVRLEQVSISPKHRPSPNVIIECCQGLVAIDPKSSIIRFTHKAVQDYLNDYRGRLFLNSDVYISSICLTYLLCDTFKHGPAANQLEIENVTKTYPLLSYVARHCRFHVYQVQTDETIKSLTLAFLASRGTIAFVNQISQFVQGRIFRYWSPQECNSLTALHLACSWGLEDIVRQLLATNRFPVDIPTKMGTTPLNRAASGGHISIVKLLLEAGANPYLENWYGNALHCAAEAGHSLVISELLNFGMVPNPCEKYSRSPLHCTIDNDHADAFETLVNLGSNIDANIDLTDTGLEVPAFHAAVQNGSSNIVDLILAKRLIDVQAKMSHGFTALHVAAIFGRTLILFKLLEAGAEVNVTDSFGRTPLDWAILHDNENCAKLLEGAGKATAPEGAALVNSPCVVSFKWDSRDTS